MRPPRALLLRMGGRKNSPPCCDPTRCGCVCKICLFPEKNTYTFCTNLPSADGASFMRPAWGPGTITRLAATLPAVVVCVKYVWFPEENTYAFCMHLPSNRSACAHMLDPLLHPLPGPIIFIWLPTTGYIASIRISGGGRVEIRNSQYDLLHFPL